eukprot:3924900-Rhodomonas_salina.1
MERIFSEGGDILHGSDASQSEGSAEERRKRAEDLKAEGNSAFKHGDRLTAAKYYASALKTLGTEDPAEHKAEGNQSGTVDNGDFQCGQRVAVPVD